MNTTKLLPLLTLLFTSLFVTAQSDTNRVFTQTDTVRIGKIEIIKYEDKTEGGHSKIIFRSKSSRKAFSKVSTNWFVFDFGFSNYIDKTDYGNTGNYLYNRQGAAPLGKSDFNLNTGKSLNVNVWCFMQRINLIKKKICKNEGFVLNFILNR